MATHRPDESTSWPASQAHTPVLCTTLALGRHELEQTVVPGRGSRSTWVPGHPLSGHGSSTVQTPGLVSVSPSGQSPHALPSLLGTSPAPHLVQLPADVSAWSVAHATHTRPLGTKPSAHGLQCSVVSFR